MYNPEKHNEYSDSFITRLSVLFDSAPFAIALINVGGKLFYINKEGKELFDLNGQGEGIRDFRLKAFTAGGIPFSPEDMPVNITLQKNETVHCDEMLVEGLSGMLKPVLLVSTPLHGLQGNTICAFVVFVDMAERKRSVARLNFQAHLLANVQEAIAAYDKDLKIIYWNEAAERMYGWTAQEMFGKRVDEVFCISAEHSLDKRVITMLLERSSSGEVLLYHKNGKLVHTEVHTKVQTDSTGAFTGAVAAFRNITCRKENELKISRQRALLKMINTIYEKSFSCDTMEDLGMSCLEVIESATKSSVSFVGDVGEDGLFYDIAVSRNGRERCRLHDRSGHNWAGNFKTHLFEAIMMRAETVIVNDPNRYADNSVLPEGHPLITSFLGTPFIKNGSVAGIVAVAGREGGYTKEDKEMLEALTPSVMEVLLRKRAEVALKKSDERLTFLLNLSDAIRLLTDPDEIETTASKLLSEHLKTKVRYFKYGEARKLYELTYRDEYSEAEKKEQNIQGWFPTAAGIMRSGKTVIVEDFQNTTLLPAEESNRAVKFGVMSTITVPLLKQGGLTACLAVCSSAPRRWTPFEISLVQETAERIWTAMDRALAVEALRKREEQFRALVTASSEVLFRMSPDCSTLTQLHGQGFLGGPEKPNSVWFEEYIHPDDQQQIEGLISEAIESRSIVELEHRIKKKEDAIGWAYTRAVPLLDSKGDVVEWFGSSIDVTGRKKVDEQLLKNKLRDELLASITARLLMSENPHQIIYDLCIMAMQHLGCDVFFNYFVDNDKGCLHLNAVSGISEEDAARFEWLDYGVAVCGCVAQAGERIITECIPGTPDSRTTEIAKLGIKAYACHPLKAENMVIGTLAFGTRTRETFTDDDIAFMNSVSNYIAIAVGRLLTSRRLKESERKAYELVGQLKKEDQNKNAFLGILSHELRNPLATITAGISLLDVTSDKRQESQAKEIIKRQSLQLCRLVDDLLDITRITQNKIRLKKERVDINKLAVLAADDMRVQFERKGVRLERTVPAGRFYLEADPARISQIIGNLLHNALKFTDSGGSVNITVYKDSDEAVITVTDTGIGLKHEMTGRIFQPFMQVDESLERGGGGLGLGLAIAKGICELHGGSIIAKSEGPGKGSTFEIRIPANSRAAIQPEKPVPEKKADRRLCILLIEDNKDFAELLCSMFRQIGHDAHLAYNGAEGINKAKLLHPDIIFCDIGLPNMNGYDVAGLIRKDDGIKGVYLVALTGYAAQQDVELAIKSGFDKHIAKPVNIDSLQRVLNQL